MCIPSIGNSHIIASAKINKHFYKQKAIYTKWCSLPSAITAIPIFTITPLKPYGTSPLQKPTSTIYVPIARTTGIRRIQNWKLFWNLQKHFVSFLKSGFNKFRSQREDDTTGSSSTFMFLGIWHCILQTARSTYLFDVRNLVPSHFSFWPNSKEE